MRMLNPVRIARHTVQLRAVLLPGLALVLAPVLLLAACAPAADDELAAGTPPDTVAADTLWSPDDTAGVPVLVSEPVTDAEPSPARPMPLPQIERPVTSGAPGRAPVRDTTRVAQAVFGRAEIAFDARTYAPADYMRVTLDDGRRRFEALSDGSGAFFFENVPVGRYQLVVTTATKDQRVVWRAPAAISGSGKVELPVIHIPIDSIRRPRG
jgi:hypothetical protein